MGCRKWYEPWSWGTWDSGGIRGRRNVLSRVEKMQAGARDSGTNLRTSLSSVRSGSEGSPCGLLGLQLPVGPA